MAYDDDPYYISAEEEALWWQINCGETDEDYERMLDAGPTLPPSYE